MRHLNAQVDDQTHEHIHTIAHRRRIRIGEAVRLAVGHYLATYPFTPLAGTERSRLRQRGPSSAPSDDGSEVSFSDLMDELEAEGLNDAS
jgi:hypothetical protein